MKTNFLCDFSLAFGQLPQKKKKQKKKKNANIQTWARVRINEALNMC